MGAYTACDLGDVTPLCTPWAEDGGLPCPVFSQEAAEASLELAASAYHMDMTAWRAAGWGDLSYLTDNTLLTGAPANGGSGSGISAVLSGYYQHMARSRIRRANPVTQVLGTLRQREGSSTCKAVVMIHPAPGGRYVVAVGFMGTGKRVFDWISNFRLNQAQGMHLGFLQLTEEFERSCDQILFPDTARALGMETLTLSDILAECRRADSRFHLWMAGHSQGGAVMQLFAWRQAQRGMLRQHMTGYGFASPSVLYRNPGGDLAALPLFHIISAEDVIPRVGARLHIGRCRVLLPDKAMRAACYRGRWQDPCFRAAITLLYEIRDSASALLWVLALLEALKDLPGDVSVSILNQLLGRVLPDKVLTVLDGGIDAVISRMMRKTARGYALSTGGLTPAPALLRPLVLRIAAEMDRYGPRLFARTLSHALALPHKLICADPALGEGAYQYTVNHRLSDLRQQVWNGASVTGASVRRADSRRAVPAGRPLARAARGYRKPKR